MRARWMLAVLVVFTLTSLLAVGRLRPESAVASAPWNAAFQRTWQRTDEPVADARVSRTWMWGPEAFTGGLLEDYDQAPGGQRLVQYYDKSRMEITTDPVVTPDSFWYVTNGLLALELTSGQQQLGDKTFAQRDPAEVNVAGDPDDATGPTYATFGSLRDAPPVADSAPIVARVTRAGVLPDDASLAAAGVTAAYHVQVDGLNHQIASPFWTFMNSAGLVNEGSADQNAPLFQNPFYATGYPISEAYWASVKLNEVYTSVLIQCFERRCLTYTPANPAGWQVETGNVGQHYFAWRYADHDPVPAPAPQPQSSPVIVIDPGHDVTSGGALGIEYLDVMRTALVTRDALQAAGYTVYLTRPDNDTILYGDPALMPPNADSMELSYNQGYAHATKALTFQPDLLLSIHYNGNDDPNAAGTTVYYCDNGGPQNATLAARMRDELASAFAELGYNPPYLAATEDGAIGKAYGHLATLGNVYNAPFDFAGNRLEGVPAVLTEALFESNPTERALIEDDATLAAFARAYVRAIDAYFGR